MLNWWRIFGSLRFDWLGIVASLVFCLYSRGLWIAVFVVPKTQQGLYSKPPQSLCLSCYRSLCGCSQRLWQPNICECSTKIYYWGWDRKWNDYLSTAIATRCRIDAVQHKTSIDVHISQSSGPIFQLLVIWKKCKCYWYNIGSCKFLHLIHCRSTSHNKLN